MSLEGISLKKIYSGKTVVDNVSIKVDAGQIVALLGPNGAGKTTVFDMIVGLVSVSEGLVLIDAKDVTSLPSYVRAKFKVAYLLQEPSVFKKLSVEENILAVMEFGDLKKEDTLNELERLLELLNLKKIRKQEAHTLSGGERRRVEFARTLAQGPKYILLDEPFTGIDPILISDMQEMIGQLKELGIGVLISDHNVRDTLSIADYAYIIMNGKIVFKGNGEEVLRNDKVRDFYLGENFCM